MFLEAYLNHRELRGLDRCDMVSSASVLLRASDGKRKSLCLLLRTVTLSLSSGAVMDVIVDWLGSLHVPACGALHVIGLVNQPTRHPLGSTAAYVSSCPVRGPCVSS